MKKYKILQVMTDAGSAHRVAANVIAKEFARIFPDKYEVKTIDLFKVSGVAPFSTSDASYALVSENQTLEALNNLVFKFTNTSIGFEIFYRYVTSMLIDECEAIIKEESPDLIISLHPIVGIVVRALKERMPELKTVQVVLDPVTIFRGWADPNADLIISPTAEAVNSIVRYGVEVSNIVYPLYPVKPEMKNFAPKEEVLKTLNLRNDKPIILMTGGGVGTQTLRKAIKNLVESGKYQIIILAGRISDFKIQLENRYGNNPDVKVLGYVDNIQDLYNACDVMVAKPSAFTVMEAEIFDIKVVWTRYIGQQDYGNVSYVQRNPKSRYIGDDWSSLIPSIEELLELNPRKPVKKFERSFDETEKIVHEIDKIADSK
jgi:processive 1,2-diacylglycerol beta-glucosyltransferase